MLANNAMLMSPNQDETAVHSCHCPCDIVVCNLRKDIGHTMDIVLLCPWYGLSVLSPVLSVENNMAVSCPLTFMQTLTFLILPF